MSDSVLKFAKALLISAVAALVFAPAWFIYSYADRIFPKSDTTSAPIASTSPTPQTSRITLASNRTPVPSVEPAGTQLPYSGLNLIIGIAAVGVTVLGFLGTVFLGVVGLQIYIGAKERERSEKVLEDVEKNGKAVQAAAASALVTMDAIDQKEQELRGITDQAGAHLARMERFAKMAAARDRDMMITGIKVRAQARRILDVKPQLPVAASVELSKEE